MKNLIILLSILTIFFSASCKKGEKLTPETQTGANTFSCKINGKVYIPENDFSVKAISVAFYNNTDFEVGANGTQYDPPRNLSIHIKNILSEGTYLLDFTQSRYVTYYISGTNNYHSKILNSGKVTITKLDRNQRIISGRFDFQLTNEKNSAETLNVTDGRFDVKY